MVRRVLYVEDLCVEALPWVLHVSPTHIIYSLKFYFDQHIPFKFLLRLWFHASTTIFLFFASLLQVNLILETMQAFIPWIRRYAIITSAFWCGPQTSNGNMHASIYCRRPASNTVGQCLADITLVHVSRSLFMPVHATPSEIPPRNVYVVEILYRSARKFCLIFNFAITCDSG